MAAKYPTEEYSDGILVRALRQAEDISQQHLAEKLGISVYRLRKIEHDKEPLDNELIKMITEWVNIPKVVLEGPDKSKLPREIFIKLKKLLINIVQIKSRDRKRSKTKRKK